MRRQWALPLGVVALLGLGISASPSRTEPAPPTPSIEVYFSPRGGCTDAVIAVLQQAKKSIYVQAYSFTSAPIARALVDAHKRGVRVEAILDKSQRAGKYTEADFLARAGISTLIDAKHAIAHNKVIIVDDIIVLTGSFNFTKSAEENNAENLLVISDARLAARYLANWANHYAHSDDHVESATSPSEK